jgi:hypothetical protein
MLALSERLGEVVAFQGKNEKLDEEIMTKPAELPLQTRNTNEQEN